MTDVYTETGKRVVFACAIQWPGWCRKGRGEDAAQAELAAYAPRYTAVAALAGVPYDGWHALDHAWEIQDKLP